MGDIMKIEKRHKLIEELLNSQGSLSIEEISQKIGVSEATIRRDLVKMEENNMIKRLWGGASPIEQDLNKHANMLDEYILKFSKNTDIKKELCKRAAQLIKDGDVIFIDAGSSTSFIIDYIEAKNITVVTNAINLLQQLASKDITTYVPCGMTNFGAAAIMGEDTCLCLANLNYDIAFLGASGVDETAGYSTQNTYDANIKRTVIANSQKCYVIADKSKLGIKKFYRFAQFNDIELISNLEKEAENE